MAQGDAGELTRARFGWRRNNGGASLVPRRLDRFNPAVRPSRSRRLPAALRVCLVTRRALPDSPLAPQPGHSSIPVSDLPGPVLVQPASQIRVCVGGCGFLPPFFFALFLPFGGNNTWLRPARPGSRRIGVIAWYFSGLRCFRLGGHRSATGGNVGSFMLGTGRPQVRVLQAAPPLASLVAVRLAGLGSFSLRLRLG